MRTIFVFCLLLIPTATFAQPRKDFKNGTFGVKSIEQVVEEEYVILRKGRKQFETHGKDSAEYRIHWFSDFGYKMTLVEANHPDLSPKEVVVNILSVRENEYTALVQSSVYGVYKVIIFRIDEK